MECEKETEWEEIRGAKVGAPKVGLRTHIRNPEQYFDCRTDLIGGGGNTDGCPWAANTLVPPPTGLAIQYKTIQINKKVDITVEWLIFIAAKLKNCIF